MAANNTIPEAQPDAERQYLSEDSGQLEAGGRPPVAAGPLEELMAEMVLARLDTPTVAVNELCIRFS